MVTDKNYYLNRRNFLKLGAGTIVSSQAIAEELAKTNLDLVPSDSEYAYNYVNFYEFSTNKSECVRLASKSSLNDKAISIEIGGLCENPMTLTDLSAFKIVERVYKLRCVEAWSMNLPWQGFELRELINLAKPISEAKFVKFTSLYDPDIFPDQRFNGVLDYPYVEGLRLDEAMHPLTLLATGLYKEKLKAQNGAPIRLVVPWKYGFKYIKSIAKIEFTKEQPISSWEKYNPNEYGFYANVNPNVPHPRWSQASHRVLGSFFKEDTQLFNGYEEEVGYLYKDLDLRKNF
ncbi:protein-methionine-sulfoxide reductase catalytic subunit MsrP [Campylobacter sp. RM12637]|uniref:protein-methionine-sulfoxide reductase catalytic subunit MsrP n=1 Tax=Campylobacter sp. RM12637 TaxID=2735734 RepID=UPI0030154A88|nr:protein-methionine-sulfoxide reductase catalytic subunit MsrP [Campylobacter sp. RM12637]